MSSRKKTREVSYLGVVQAFFLLNGFFDTQITQTREVATLFKKFLDGFLIFGNDDSF